MSIFFFFGLCCEYYFLWSFTCSYCSVLLLPELWGGAGLGICYFFFFGFLKVFSKIIFLIYLHILKRYIVLIQRCGSLDRRRVWGRMDTCIGEGNGNLLQYSCLENPMVRGAWWATVHRVTQSQTQLKRLSTTWHGRGDSLLSELKNTFFILVC